ncbi:hypothetical protein ASPZODRAFT_1360433 [Penicilliopsis zonata CBS 506.65]|uniref:Cytochrome P450 n=1 Tax=Penicilliopsis zonata CBS 506.65 TaxID=1073090 RepID=A0A1L9SP17_9EURO|nr:hypothetical protein ASPZODRAFT_1360433 [Penicilliopsis zonata CBS 506.65]OJJ48948.1 hypothetical protein ASPZODRAFT_1360433 [Penicilliopsis zonata CBS 506.65]
MLSKEQLEDLLAVTDCPVLFWLLVGVIFLFLHWNFWPSSRNRLEIPVIRSSNYLPDVINRVLYLFRAPYLIHYGYRKNKNSAFRLLRWGGDLIVLPLKYVDDFKNLPADMLDARSPSFEKILTSYMVFMTNHVVAAETVKKRLNPALGRLFPRFMDELDYAFQVEFPSSDEIGGWVRVKPMDVITRIVTRATSRVMIGDDTCRNEIWIDTASSYAQNVIKAVKVLSLFPEFLRPLVANILPCTRRLRNQLAFIRDTLLVPMIHERRADERSGDPQYARPDDFLQYLMDFAEDYELNTDAARTAHDFMAIVGMATVWTTSSAITQALLDLVVLPEFLPPMRWEIRASLGRNSWKDITEGTIVSQRRLDSFLKESIRLSPPMELTFHRILKEPIVLYDGVVLPKGTRICFPSGPISRDPGVITHPDSFNCFRWCFTTPSPWNSLVNVNPTNLHFGIGQHACPGRYFAAYVMKAILGRIIYEYDFRYEVHREDRPDNVYMGEAIFPDANVTLLFRKRLGIY